MFIVITWCNLTGLKATRDRRPPIRSPYFRLKSQPISRDNFYDIARKIKYIWQDFGLIEIDVVVVVVVVAMTTLVVVCSTLVNLTYDTTYHFIPIGILL